MNFKPRFQDYYMDVAKRSAEMSYAKRLQVGACAVLNDTIISTSWNGTPSGTDNTCEDVLPDGTLKTKSTVLHAEENMLLKLLKKGTSANGATLFVTHAPCINCARLVWGAGFTKVYYDEAYRSTEGIEFLKSNGVVVEKYDSENLWLRRKPTEENTIKLSEKGYDQFLKVLENPPEPNEKLKSLMDGTLNLIWKDADGNDVLPQPAEDCATKTYIDEQSAPKIIIATDLSSLELTAEEKLKNLLTTIIEKPVQSAVFPTTTRLLVHPNWNKLLFDENNSEFYYFCLWKGELFKTTKHIEAYNAGLDGQELQEFKEFCAARLREQYVVNEKVKFEFVDGSDNTRGIQTYSTEFSWGDENMIPSLYHRLNSSSIDMELVLNCSNAPVREEFLTSLAPPKVIEGKITLTVGINKVVYDDLAGSTFSRCLDNTIIELVEVYLK